MNGLSSFVSGLLEAMGGLGSTGTGMLGDRLELAALELREAKIRLIQALILTCVAVVFSLFGIILLVLAVVYALPDQWRLHALAALGVLGLLAGLGAFLSLRRRMVQPFAQTLTELNKDKQCF
jgi:uncharacterized membrane protein YqjE